MGRIDHRSWHAPEHGDLGAEQVDAVDPASAAVAVQKSSLSPEAKAALLPKQQ